MVKKTTQKKQKTPPSINRVVITLLLVVILSSVATVVLLSLFDTKPDEVKVVSYTYSVKDRVGIVLDNDALHFGGGPAGSRLQRSINLSTSKDARVKITFEGEGTVVVSDNNFELVAGEPKLLTFYIDIPKNANLGFYEGKIFFSFYR